MLNQIQFKATMLRNTSVFISNICNSLISLNNNQMLLLKKFCYSGAAVKSPRYYLGTYLYGTYV